MKNPFDQFDEAEDEGVATVAKNPFDSFDQPDQHVRNPFDQFDPPGTIRGTWNSARRGYHQAGQAFDAAQAMYAQGRAATADAAQEMIKKRRGMVPEPRREDFAKYGRYAESNYQRAVENHRITQARYDSEARAEAARKKALEPLVPELITDIARRQKKIDALPQSKGKEAYDAAEGIGGALAALARNPIDVIAGIAAESLPASAPSLALGAAGSVAGPAGTAAGAGAGSLATEYASTILQELQETKGVDFEKPETVIEVLKNPEVMERIRAKALKRGIPVAAFDAMSAGVAGRLFRTAGGKTVLNKIGRGAAEMGVQGAMGGAGEAAGGLVSEGKIDPKAVLSEVLGEMGSGAGEIVTGTARDARMRNAERGLRNDTGKNVPERVETLRAQQKALIEGRQRAQMFPTGTNELALPEGFDRVETQRGVFHFDPDQITAQEIIDASKTGRENEVLGLGPASKADIDARAARGEPVTSVVEQTPDGGEVKAALATPSTIEATAAEMQARAAEGNRVVMRNPNEVVAARSGSFLDTLLSEERAAADERRTAEERERAGRTQRQQELDAKKSRFDESVNASRAIARDANADYGSVNGALQTMRFYAEDNAIGLTQQQRAQARQAVAFLAKREAALRPAHEAAQERLNAERLKAEKEKQAAQRQRIRAEQSEVEQQTAAGIAADGNLDYAKLNDARLETLAENGDERAGREIERRALAPDETTQETLLDVLRETGLPTDDESLGGELKLMREEMSEGERLRYFRKNMPGGLDRLAERLRERGFDEAQTPADVLALTQRALRGERIVANPREGAQVEYAEHGGSRGMRQQLAPNTIARWFENVRGEFPELAREIDIEQGLVDEELRKRGYKGEVPAGVRAVMARLQGQKAFIALAARLWQSKGEGAHLLSHEVAHAFLDSLPAETRAQLRELYESETSRRTGPLFDKDGKPATDIKFLPEQFSEARLRRDPDLPFKEWFAERVAMLNRDWVQGRIDRAGHSLMRRVAHELREWVRRIWTALARREGISPDSELFESAFRRFLEGGARADIAQEAGMAYAAAAAARRAQPYSGGITAATLQKSVRIVETGVAGAGNPVAGLRGKSIENTDTGKPVKIVREAVKKIGSTPRSAETNAILAALPEILRTMRLVTSEADNQARHGVVSALRFLAAVRVGSNIVPVRITAHEVRGQGLNLHYVEPMPKEARPARELPAVTGTSPLDGLGDGRDLKVADLLPRVKPEDGGTFSAEFADTAATPTLDFVRSEWDRMKVDGYVSEANGVITVHRIVVPESIRKNGTGTTAMRLLADYADRTNQSIALTPTMDFGASSKSRLTKFYRKLGFFENKGRNKDWQISQKMIRRPNSIEFAESVGDFDAAQQRRMNALISQLKDAKRARDAALVSENDELLAGAQARVERITGQLDLAFPDWQSGYAEKPAGRRERRKNVIEQDDGRNLPPQEPSAQEGAAEQSPFIEDDMREQAEPVRAGKMNEVFGHGAAQPSSMLKTWERVRNVITGIRGAIPELPTFPAAWWNKADAFIKAHGDTFYNKVKEGLRSLKSANDYIQKAAELQVSRIIKPLLRAEQKEGKGGIDATGYARLRTLQERARRLQADGKPVPAAVAREIGELNARLESSPYVLFNKLIVALDFHWRQQNLKDDAGNAIKMPAGVNSAEVQAELQRLGAAIEASPHAERIKTAVREHMALVKQVAEDLKGRELLAGDHLANPYYFPHLTLEQERGGKTVQRELTPHRVRPGTEADFRGYLMDPVGSIKAIDTDYVRAMYYHLVQVGAHNHKADVVRDSFRPYDVMDKVRERAKQLGKQRGVPVSWQQAFHEEFAPQGYVLYGTDSRDMFPSLEVNRDALAKRLGVALTSENLHKQLKELGVKGVQLLPEDLQETLAQGARETWVVPSRVADALRGIAERQTRRNNAIETALKWTVGKWKQWKLFMPWNHIRYEFNNIVADVEKTFSSNPRTFKYLPAAAREIRDFFKGGKPSADLAAALKDGVINAITAQEMNQLTGQRAFEDFETKAQSIWRNAKARSSSAFLQPLTNLVGVGDLSSVQVSAMREAITRYANYKANLEAIRNGARPEYGGAYWRDIEAIGDSAPGANDAAQRKAAQISKSTFGDYGDLSVLGEYTREKLVPFYSWMEVNFKYHANLLRNLRDMAGGKMDGVPASAKSAAGAAARVAGALASKGARKAAGVVLRLAIPYVAVAIWNNTGDRDELEKQLSEEDRRRFHIILGKDENGKVRVIYGNTALGDVMRWFSGERFTHAMMGWMSGRTDFQTAVSAWADYLAPDFVNNIAQSVGPAGKLPYTILSKKNVFPDVTDQRTIPAYDMRRNIIGQMTDEFTADMIERLASKDYYGSKDMGDWAKQLILQVRMRDPESWAFYEIKDKANDFVERKTGRHRDSAYDAPDQQVLRNFRRAIFRGDVEHAVQFYNRLLDYGYTSERLTASIRAQDPLSGVPRELRREFYLGLDEMEREQLVRAYEFYLRMATQRGSEKGLFPSKRWGEKGVQLYQQNPQTQRLERLLEASMQMRESPAALRARAEQELRRALAPARR